MKTLAKKKKAQKPIDALLVRVLSKLKPPEKITVSKWAEKYRVVSQESASAPGRWRNDKVPYLVEIMDCVNDRQVKEIVIMASSQVGKSECLNNILGYFIDIDPCPIMMIQPTIAMAAEYSKQRIAPMIRDCDRLRLLVSEIKSKDSNNTILSKSFPGGYFVMSGSNSPASLSSKPIRVLLVDEVDRMENTSEGDPVALAEKRSITFYNRLSVKVSSPSIKDLSRIERAYNRSDQRKFYVPCPSCGTYQTLRWSQVKWEKKEDGSANPDTAWYECENCLKKIYDQERYSMVRVGEWRARHKFAGVVGFHLNELYSSWRRLKDIVKAFIDAEKSIETLKVFINTTLGESFQILGKAPDWKKLFERREKYTRGIVPPRAVFLTGGADVQEDRIHVEIVAWGRNFETWSIDYAILYGDTSADAVWSRLDSIVCAAFHLAEGGSVGISRFCIDAGYNTTAVHNWARKYPGSRVSPVIGRAKNTTIVSTPIRVDVINSKKKATGMKSYPVGSSVVKLELFGFLRQAVPQPGEGYPFGYCHFPDYEEDFFKELTAENLVEKKNRRGYVSREWEKHRERNEALDCRVYNRAAACLFGIDRFSEEDWVKLEINRAEPITTKKRQEIEIVEDDEYLEGYNG